MACMPPTGAYQSVVPPRGASESNGLEASVLLLSKGEAEVPPDDGSSNGFEAIFPYWAA